MSSDQLSNNHREMSPQLTAHLLDEGVVLHVEGERHDAAQAEVLHPLQPLHVKIFDTKYLTVIYLQVLAEEGDVTAGVRHGDEAVPLRHGRDPLLQPISGEHVVT